MSPQINNRLKHGFSLTELVVSISLFTILIMFLSSSIYFLLAESKNVTFKNQGLFLAQQKLDEFVYAVNTQNDDIYYNNQTFAPPYDKFFYSVALGNYGTSHKIVLVDVWTGSAAKNKNNIQLSGLAYKEESYTFKLPDNISAAYRIYWDPVNKTVMIREGYGPWSGGNSNYGWYQANMMYRGYFYRTSTYDMTGKRNTIPYLEKFADSFFGWSYNAVMKCFYGVITTGFVYSTSWIGPPTGISILTAPTSGGYLNLTAKDSSGKVLATYGSVSRVPGAVAALVNVRDAIACANDGSTYIIDKEYLCQYNRYHSNMVKQQGTYLWAANPADRTFQTKVISIQNNPQLGWPMFGRDSRGAYIVASDISNVSTDPLGNVIATLNTGLVEFDKNLNNPKVIMPSTYTFTVNNTSYTISPSAATRDKYGNIYVIEGGGQGAVNTNVYKFKANGVDWKNNYQLTPLGKVGTYKDFSISSDGSRIITMDATSVSVKMVKP